MTIETTRAAFSPRNLGKSIAGRVTAGLVGLMALLAPGLPAFAQPVPGRPCEAITAACKNAGFVYGAVQAGNGLLVDCIRPIMQGTPQPPTARRRLPAINPQLIDACRARDPSFGMAGAAPPAAPANDEFVYNDDTYGWYDDGWNGPGWYIVGHEFRRGAGFGGRAGWNGWRHGGSHPHTAARVQRRAVSAQPRVAGVRHNVGRPHRTFVRSRPVGRPRHARGGSRPRHVNVVHHNRGGQRRGAKGRNIMSDIRLKHDIVFLGRLENGLGFYRFSYNGSEKPYVGVMAQEVQAVVPEAVARGRDGYLLVNYDRLGIRMQTWDEWVAAGQRIPAAASARH